jgi:HK97 family phage portal protein
MVRAAATGEGTRMSLISNLVVKNYSLADFDRDIKSFLTGRITHSGVPVNEENALKYITVFSCVRVLAETLGCLPLAVYKERAGGGQDKARDHPVYWLLHDEPNDEMTSQTFRETGMGHLALSGNCYAVISRNLRGNVTDIYPLDWNKVEPKRNPDTRKIEYHVHDRGSVEVFPADQILHIPGLGYDGIRGYSPIRMAQEAVGLGLAATEFAARFFGQGMNMGGVLEHPTKLSDEAYGRIKKSLEDEGSGLANSWRPLILEEGMKYARIPMPLTEAQFLENRKFTQAEICGLFRVPPHLIADLDRSTNNNIEQQSLEFTMYDMLPYFTRWEQAINRRLFTRKEREQGYYAQFNVKGLLRGDYKSRQEGLATMRQNGVINADEWRELEEINPIEGTAGTAYLVNGSMISTETAAQQDAKTARERNPGRPQGPGQAGERGERDA